MTMRLLMIGALSWGAACRSPVVLSGEYVADSSADRVEVESHGTRFTVKFDMGSEIEFEMDGDRSRGIAVAGQRVMMETYVIGGGVPCLVNQGRASFHKEALERQRFRFRFDCHREGHPTEVMGYGFEGDASSWTLRHVRERSAEFPRATSAN